MRRGIMQTKEIVFAIIHLPSEFNRKGDSSFYELLKSTEYFSFFSQINVPDLIEGLKQYPDCVFDWLQYSEDKRTSDGYYFIRHKEEYRIGNLNRNGTKQSEEKYEDRFLACATFIKYEVEGMRK